MTLPIAEWNVIATIIILVGLGIVALILRLRLAAWLRRRRPQQRPASRPAAPARRQWQMCVVSTDEQEPYVEYWDETGPDRKSLIVEDATTPDATRVRTRRVLAQLGEAGWEMAGVDGPRVYMKRPKPQ